ncbi:MAG: hypothetical protein ABL959_12355 [Pyrinomonadaceae bacterium]
MFSTIFLLTLFATAFFTAENLVTTMVGFVITAGLTQWLKNASGVYGLAAFAVAVIVSFVVASIAVVASSFMNGTGFAWETIPQSALQIFALATMAYKLVLADKE